MRALFLDTETFGRVDLKKQSAWKYIEDDSFGVMCMSHAFFDTHRKARGTIRTWSPIKDERLWTPEGVQRGPKADFLSLVPDLECPEGIRAHIAAGGIVFAHNAGFDKKVWNDYLVPVYGFPFIPLDQWRCSMAVCLNNGLPGKLETVTKILWPDDPKDMAGNAVMQKLSKPRGVKQQFAPLEASDVSRLFEYCEKDVQKGIELVQMLEPLSDKEQEIWKLDQIINSRGVRVDVELAKAAVELYGNALEVCDQEMAEITDGAIGSVTQVKKIAAYIRDLGFKDFKSTAKEALDIWLADNGPLQGGTKESKKALQVLMLRREFGSAAIKKFQAMLECEVDGRIRGHLSYYGAHKTGRWVGKSVQLQNFLRGSIKGQDRIALAVKLIKAKDVKSIKREFPDLPLLVVLGSTLRACIIPDSGKKMVCSDLKGIEYRTLMWHCGQDDKMEQIALNDADPENYPDSYVSLGSRMLGIPWKDIKPAERQIGKVGVLGSGYGMADKAMVEYARIQFRLILKQKGPGATAETIIKTYRSEHPQVLEFWRQCGNAAISAIGGEKTVKVFRNTFFMRNGNLIIRLPSGRDLVYFKPSLSVEVPEYEDGKKGQPRTVVKYWGVHSKTKQWCQLYIWGGVIVGHINQATARDLIAESMLRIDEAGYPCILTVHDEDIAEVPDSDEYSLKAFNKLVKSLPDWIKDMPCEAEGWEGYWYRK